MNLWLFCCYAILLYFNYILSFIRSEYHHNSNYFFLDVMILFLDKQQSNSETSIRRRFPEQKYQEYAKKTSYPHYIFDEQSMLADMLAQQYQVNSTCYSVEGIFVFLFSCRCSFLF